jgi:tetratricopeptide (TPR) repeat protein
MSDLPAAASPASEAESTGQPNQQRKTIFKLTSAPSSAGAPYLAPNLPLYFVPRAELLSIKQLLLSKPTALLAPLTVHGPAGSGKTSLATAVAHDADLLETYPDGVLWTSLGEEGDVQHAQATWADALGIDLSHLPDTSARAAALRTMLRDARAILIIDDVTDVEQVRALNVGGPNCVRVITTDKVDEISYGFKTRRYAVNQLSQGEAIQLLTEWAGILPDIYLPTVNEIIERLLYSAQALSLVGAQARQGITWLRLLEVLRGEQGPLATIDADNPQHRQQALGIVLNLVLARFGGAQLERSRVLAAFAPGMSCPFSVEAAAAVWGMPTDDAADTLKALVEAAIIQKLPDDYYAMHSTISDHLRKSSPPDLIYSASRRIYDFYTALVGVATSRPEAIDHQMGQIMMTYRHLELADPPTAGEFAASLMNTFEQRGLWSNFILLCRQAVAMAREAGDTDREDEYLSDLGYAYSVMGDLHAALAAFTRSLDIAREHGDPDAEATALNNLGAIYERLTEYESARAHYEQSLELRESLGLPEDIAEALNNLAGVLYRQQRYDESLNTFHRALDIFGVLTNRDGQAQTWLNIGAVHEATGHDSDAQQAYQRSLAIYTNLGNETGQAQAYNNLGISFFNQGDTERALAHFKRSLAIKEKMGDRLGEASTLNNIALLYEKTGSVSLALDNYERSYYILDSLADPRAEVVQQNIDTLRAEMK